MVLSTSGNLMMDTQSRSDAIYSHVHTSQGIPIPHTKKGIEKFRDFQPLDNYRKRRPHHMKTQDRTGLRSGGWRPQELGHEFVLLCLCCFSTVGSNTILYHPKRSPRRIRTSVTTHPEPKWPEGRLEDVAHISLRCDRPSIALLAKHQYLYTVFTQ